MTKEELKEYKKQLKKEEAIKRIKSEEKTPFLLRLRYKYLTLYFLKKVLWAIFRFVLLVGISYVILFPYISKIAGQFFFSLLYSSLVIINIFVIPLTSSSNSSV